MLFNDKKELEQGCGSLLLDLFAVLLGYQSCRFGWRVILFLGYKMDSTDQAQASQRRKTCGPTRCLSMQSLPPTERIQLAGNDINQPIEEHAATFTRYCGLVIRDGNMIPIDCATWKHVLEESKRRAFEMVQEKYLFTEEHYDYVVNKVMSNQWRDHKNELKKKYFNELDPHGSVPSSVIEAQWHVLVEYWLSEARQKSSETNKRNRQKQVLSHTAGTKAIARVRDEMTSDGIPPSRAKLFIKTHSRKDGMPVNDVAAEKIEMRSTALEGSIDSIGRDDAFSQVMGPARHGCVRGNGLGSTPIGLWGACLSGFSPQSFHARAEIIRELQEQLVEKIKTIEEMQPKIIELEDKCRQSDDSSKIMEEMILEMRTRILQMEDRYRHIRS